MDVNKALESFKEAAKDESFVENLVANMDNYEEFAKVFDAKGVDWSEDDKRQLFDLVRADQELSEDNLNDVAGGSAFLTGMCLIGGGIAFAVGVIKGATSCKKKKNKKG